jgi:hypothetical protein
MHLYLLSVTLEVLQKRHTLLGSHKPFLLNDFLGGLCRSRSIGLGLGLLQVGDQLLNQQIVQLLL